MNISEFEEKALKASELLKAMGNENRLLILCQLVSGERSVGYLKTVIGLSQSAMSQHLSILRQSGLVKTRRDAQNIYYSIAAEEPQAMIESLYNLYADSSCREAPQEKA